VGDEIGGHAVSGHVHTTAAIADVTETPNNRRLRLRLADPAWGKYILPKGFVSLDGCSLTVGEVEESGAAFSVYLIPETLRVTGFGFKGVGDTLNVEVEAQTQAIVDTVERVVAAHLGRLGLSGGGGVAAGVGAAAAATATAGDQ
jgi:riboflavin synthase